MRKFWNGIDREYKLLLFTWLFIGITGGIYDAVFNNYVNDVFHISAQVRGYLEFPREFPGFVIAIITGLLMFIADIRLMGVAVGLTTLGMVGQSFYMWRGEPQFAWMIVSMVIWSVGTHLFMPLSSSVSLRLSKEGNFGRTLGMMNGFNTFSSVIGGGAILLVMGVFKLQYSWIFWVAALFGILAVICSLLMKVQHQSTSTGVKFRLLFRGEYSLFYWLSVIYGARKQVFLTFAPWVLVKVFKQPPTMMAILSIVSSLIGAFFKPFLGHLIDRVGEKRVILSEAVIFLFVCFGYGLARHIGLGVYAIYLVFFCYIVDMQLSSVNMARTTYLHKNLVKSEDLTPTLSMGVSMDHMVAMLVPTLGGLLWEAFGYESIFFAAAFISLANIFIAKRIREKEPGQISMSC